MKFQLYFIIVLVLLFSEYSVAQNVNLLQRRNAQIIRTNPKLENLKSCALELYHLNGTDLYQIRFGKWGTPYFPNFLDGSYMAYDYVVIHKNDIENDGLLLISDYKALNPIETKFLTTEVIIAGFTGKNILSAFENIKRISFLKTAFGFTPIKKQWPAIELICENFVH